MAEEGAGGLPGGWPGTERLVVRGLLGRGGMGEVYRADDRELGRAVAVKRLRPGRDAGVGALSRFAREARVLARLRHPHLVEVLDWVEGDGEALLVLELLPGPSLEDRLRQGPLREAEVVELGRQLAAALGSLHGAGVLHRDLKPANVMQRAPGDWVLMDMGLAQVLEETRLTATGEVVGTPVYLAPEVVEDEAWGPACDQYQLGAVLFEALTGLAMVPGVTVQEVLTNLSFGVRRGFDEGPRPVPVGLQRVVRRATARDPARRFPDLAALATALERGAAEAPRAAAEAATLSAPLDLRLPRRAEASQLGAGRSRRLPPFAAGAAGSLMLAGVVALGLVLVPRAAPPAAPPHEVGVVGDALVVAGAPGGAPVVTVGGRAVPVEPVGPGRWAARGLGTEAAEVRVEVAGRAPQVLRLAAGAPAVAAGVRLVPGPLVAIRLRRAVAVGWEGTTPRVGAAGEALRLPPPPAGARPVLEWVEAGMRFQRELAWADEVAAALEAALAATDPDPTPAFLAASIAGESRDLPRPWEPWRELADWIPQLLAGPHRERVWEGWQRAQRAVAQARLVGQAAEALETAFGRAGGRSQQEPPRPRPPPRLVIDVEGGRPEDWTPGRFQLKAPVAVGFDVSLDRADAATRVVLAPRPDSAAEALRVAVKVQNHDPLLAVALRARGVEQDLELFHLVDPGRSGSYPKYDGWLVAWVPAWLLPAGAPLEVTLRPVLRTWLWTVKVREVGVGPAP